MSIGDTIIVGSKYAIGARLRKIREEQKVSGNDLASRIECTQSRISKIEKGDLKVTPTVIDKYVDALNLPKTDAKKLHTLVEMFQLEYSRWNLAQEDMLANLQKRVGQYERRAQYVRSYQQVCIPGLLQTKPYMQNVFSRGYNGDRKEIDAAMSQRVKRQRVLKSKSKLFHFVIEEGVLRRPMCSVEDMREQLAHILEVEKMQNVHIGVLPTDTRVPAIPVTSFDILDDHVVMIETRFNNITIWDPDQVSEYTKEFQLLEDVAISGRQLKNLFKYPQRR